MEISPQEHILIAELLDPKTQNKAFKKLIANNKIILYNHIRTLVLNHDDTEDVLQNTFIKIFSHLNSFNKESKLLTWMYRIATNEAINYLKSKASKNGMCTEELQEHLVEDLYSDSYYDGDEIQIKLQKAIAKLPEKQQLVFKMKYFQELKYEEISEILDTSIGALKASYHHAVKKIESFLNED